MNGKIFLDRKILDWEWYGEKNTCRLFIHILIKANWKDKKWRGDVIKRGSLITSTHHLSEETGMTTGEVRTSLEHLIRTGEIIKRTTNLYTIITVVNYDKYQIVGQLNSTKEEKPQGNRYSTSFEKAWEMYPRKDDKSLAYNAYKARLNDGFSEDDLLYATKAYAEQCKKENREKRYIKSGKSFYGVNTPFADYLKKNEVVKPTVEPPPLPDEKENEDDEDLSEEEWFARFDDMFGEE